MRSVRENVHLKGDALLRKCACEHQAVFDRHQTVLGSVPEKCGRRILCNVLFGGKIARERKVIALFAQQRHSRTDVRILAEAHHRIARHERIRATGIALDRVFGICIA